MGKQLSVTFIETRQDWNFEWDILLAFWILEVDTGFGIDYRPSTKLREGNVFARACPLTGGPHVTITYNAMDFTVQPPPAPTSNLGSPKPQPPWTSDLDLPAQEPC